MKKQIFYLAVISVIALMASCTHNKKADGPDALVSHIDSTINPATDFFMYANGKWFKQNPIPASEQSNGIFQLIQDTINAQIRKICETSAAKTDAEKGSNKQLMLLMILTGL
jgi:putative endopeptidase